jgi:hypothetical protein
MQHGRAIAHIHLPQGFAHATLLDIDISDSLNHLPYGI